MAAKYKYAARKNSGSKHSTKRKRYILNDSQRLLVESNWPVAVDFARSVDPPDGYDRQEWEGECLHRLCIAAATYDPSRGRFTNYAVASMFANRTKVLWHNRRPMRDVRRTQRITDLAWRRLSAKSPTDQLENRDFLKVALSKLKLKEQKILRLRSYGYTMAQIGKRMGISKQRVQQIENHALFQVRNRLGIRVPEFPK